jgi:hypothetical protein
VPVTIEPNGWFENHIKIDGKVLKTAAPIATYDHALPRRDAIHMMIILVYCAKPYKLKLDGVQFK